MKLFTLAALLSLAALPDATPINGAGSPSQKVMHPSGKTEHLNAQSSLDDYIASSPVLSLHRSLCEIESISNNEKEVGSWLADYLRDQDFEVELQPIEYDWEDPSKAEAGDDDSHTPKRFNVYARPRGSPNPQIILTSHIDTVPPYIPYSLRAPSDAASFAPSDIEIRGRGTVDAKASVAAQIFAAVHALHDIPDLPLGLLFVVGEETGGKGMKGFSGSARFNSVPPGYHTVIFGEPTELRLVAGHKGIAGFKVKARGRAAHSGYPWLGRSAVSDILPVLGRIDVLGGVPESEGGLLGSEKFGETTVNIGRVEAGVAVNVVPVEAEARVSLRLAAGTVEDARRIVERAVREYAPVGSNVTADFESMGFGSGPTEIDADVEGFEVMTVNYGTDVPNLTYDDREAEIKVKRYLYGPGNIFVAHGDNEALRVGDIFEAVQGYEKLIAAAVARTKNA